MLFMRRRPVGVQGTASGTTGSDTAVAPVFRGTSSQPRRYVKIPTFRELKSFENVDRLWTGRYPGYPPLRDFSDITSDWVHKDDVASAELSTQRSIFSKLSTVQRRIEELQRDWPPDKAYQLMQDEYGNISRAYDSLKSGFVGDAAGGGATGGGVVAGRPVRAGGGSGAGATGGRGAAGAGVSGGGSGSRRGSGSAASGSWQAFGG